MISCSKSQKCSKVQPIIPSWTNHKSHAGCQDLEGLVEVFRPVRAKQHDAQMHQLEPPFPHRFCRFCEGCRAAKNGPPRQWLDIRAAWRIVLGGAKFWIHWNIPVAVARGLDSDDTQQPRLLQRSLWRYKLHRKQISKVFDWFTEQ